MSLRINTNVAALNSYNNLNANQSKLEGAFQQLSSGLRINKAADDAAGLSIAQGLTSQINGLTQAVSNANDGINVAQIADGALGTTQDILQRMRGLIVKAGNEGTQDSKSLGAIQQEIQNLNTQLDNIAGQTKFGQVNLLDGNYNKNFQVGANGGDTIKLDLSNAAVKSTSVGGVDLTALNIAKSVDVNNVIGWTPATANVASVQGFDGLSTATTIADAPNGNAGWVITDGTNTLGTVRLGDNGVYTVSKSNSDGTSTVVGRIDAATHDPAFTAPTAGNVATGGSGTLDDALSAAFGAAPAGGNYVIASDGSGGWTVSDDGTVGQLGTISVSAGVYSFTNGSTGATTWVNTNAFVPQAAGDIQSYSSAQATTDLASLDTAIGAVSQARSQIGAVQNQLSYTVSNLQTAITNVTASRSNLTDADLAQQVTAMTQSQILTQAATSVLAQANSAPQAILKLLQ